MDAAEWIQLFDSDGYVQLPNLDSDTAAAICRRLDYFATTAPGRKELLPDEFFNSFVVHARLLEYATKLLGDTFMLHHACGRALYATGAAKEWHHDFDGLQPWEPSSPLMIHFMIYPKGLTAETGPLLVLPGSHKLRVARDFPRQYRADTIPGSAQICGEPGLILVMNSALWHARRPLRCAPRYDMNVSFCQPGIERPERKNWTGAFLAMAVEALRANAPENPLSRPGLLAG